MPASAALCLSGPRTPELSLADHIRVASEAGFSALDLWAPKLDAYLATYPVIWLDTEMQKHRVYATSVSGIALSPSDDKEARLLQEARFLELCTDLDALGGGIIAVWPDTGFRKEADNTRVVPWLIHTLKHYADLAAPFEVRIALELEAHASSAVPTLASSQEVVRQTGRANVGLALSIGQLRESPSGPEDLETLDVEKLWLVRLEAIPLPGPAGEGRGESHPFTVQHATCQQLAAKGFRGLYCVDWPTQAPASQLDEKQDSLTERARRSRQAALELLASL